MLALREEARRGFAAVLGVDAGLVALTDSTTRGCQIVLDRARARLRRRGRHDRPGALRADGPAARERRAGRPHRGGRGRDPGRGDAEDAADRRCRTFSGRRGGGSTSQRLRDESGVPLLVDGAQSAGAIETGAAAYDFYTVSAQKWLCAPEPTGALYVRDPERVAVALPSYLAQRGYELSGAFTPKEGAARFDAWIGTPTLAGLVAASRNAPRLALRAERRGGRPLPRAARPARRGRDPAGPLDARVVPAAGRSDGARGEPRRART